MNLKNTILKTQLPSLVRNLSALHRPTVIAVCWFVCAAAQAQLNISSLNTGAGQDSQNYISGANVEPNPLTDPKWSVTWLSLVPPSGGGTGGPGPGGIPTGTAYLVPWDILGSFPLFDYYVGSDSDSSWLTYADPQNPNGWFTGGDVTGDTYQYQLTFTAANSGLVAVRWLSDDESSLYLNNTLVGSTPMTGTYSNWTADSFSVIEGTTYVVDINVINNPQNNGNPTGARVEFAGDVNVIPEPTTVGLVAIGLLGALTIGRHRARSNCV